MPKALSRVLDADGGRLAQHLASHSITTCEQFLGLSDVQQVAALDMPARGAAAVDALVARAVAPAPMTAWDLWERARGEPRFVPCPLPSLSAAIHGGFAAGQITEARAMGWC